jgi:hypothetical protein
MKVSLFVHVDDFRAMGKIMIMSKHLRIGNRLAAAAVSAICFTAVAHAAPIDVFNTGVDANGLLPNGTLGDPHYSLYPVLSAVPQPDPAGASTVLRVVTQANGFPIGPWLLDDTSSRWIGPDSGINIANHNSGGNNDSVVNALPGYYDYRTTFDLAEVTNHTIVTLAGQWAADNSGANIFLNGVSTGDVTTDFSGNAPFQHWTAFTITGNFIEGINTLDFIVKNDAGSPLLTDPNPTGLRVEFLTATDVVPEPATLALFGASLAGLGVLRRRKAA